MKKSIAIFIIAALVCISSAFAQEAVQGRSGNGSVAGATSGATAIIDQSGGRTLRPLPGSIPGAQMVFPGYAPMPGGWEFYRPAAKRFYTMEQISRMKRSFGFGDVLPSGWKKRVRVVVIDPAAVAANNDPIYTMGYWPEFTAYDDDQIIGRVTVDCDYLAPAESCLGLGLEKLKVGTHTKRVAIRFRMQNDMVTKGMSLGLGASGARMTQPGADNDGVAVSAGVGFGSTTAGVHGRQVFEIIAMNDIPKQLEPPMLPVAAAPPPPPPPTPIQVQANVNMPAISIPPIKVEVDLGDALKQLAEAMKALQPPPQAAAQPPVVAQAPVEVCAGLPQFTIYFEFDRDVVRNQYQAGIKDMVTWLNEHPSCHVEVQGHTCTIGSEAYNADLGLRRAVKAYDAFIAAGAKPSQVEQKMSGGEGMHSERFNPEDRRVILQGIGPRSGR